MPFNANDNLQQPGILTIKRDSLVIAQFELSLFVFYLFSFLFCACS